MLEGELERNVMMKEKLLEHLSIPCLSPAKHSTLLAALQQNTQRWLRESA